MSRRDALRETSNGGSEGIESVPGVREAIPQIDDYALSHLNIIVTPNGCPRRDAGNNQYARGDRKYHRVRRWRCSL